MRAAAILGLGCSSRDLEPFQNAQTDTTRIDWRIGMPSAADQVDVILLFSGDGTIHRHLGQLVMLGLPVLIVPEPLPTVQTCGGDEGCVLTVTW